MIGQLGWEKIDLIRELSTNQTFGGFAGQS